MVMRSQYGVGVHVLSNLSIHVVGAEVEGCAVVGANEGALVGKAEGAGIVGAGMGL